MNENEYWIKFWRTVAAFLILFTGIVGGCTVHQNEVKKDLIASGKDPIEVTCAIDGMGESRQITCFNAINKFDIK